MSCRSWLGCAGLLAGVFLAMAPSAVTAQGLEYVQENYTKYEYEIPMRDGVKLFTAVFVPKDTSKTYPILLNRTPYGVGPYGIDRSRASLGPAACYPQAGYIFAYQDVRGRWMSEGTFVNMRPIRSGGADDSGIDESTDAYDTVAWLLAHVTGHNGKVGQWGISYPGFYTACALVNPHPALVAASPQAPVTDWFVGDDWHHNGAMQLAHSFNFMANFGHPRPVPTSKPTARFDHGTHDGYHFFLDLGPLSQVDAKYFKGDIAFWDEMMAHGTYDEFWKARNLRPHLKGVKPSVAVLTVGGWFDAENLFGALETYRTIEATSPQTSNRLVMGPWLHGGWAHDDGSALGPVRFAMKTSEFYRDRIEFPFFEHHLKGKPLAEEPEAWVFETGRNQWRALDAWPPRTARPATLSFRGGSSLSFDPTDDPDADAHDEFVSDPARPVPFIGSIGIEMAPEYMVADQRFASRRTDVLVYQTEPLSEDVTFAGPMRADLIVSTSGSDADWIVKLIDVSPDNAPDPEPNPSGVHMDGYQQLVRGDVLRGKFRGSLEIPEPFRPDEPTSLGFALQDIFHTFRSGHRIMIQVQSTWFPLIDRNPQTYTDIYKAKASDFHPAVHRVYRSKARPSHVNVMVLPAPEPRRGE